MVQFLLTVGSFGLLYQRFQNAICRRRDGDGSRRRLFCGRLSLVTAFFVGSFLVEAGAADPPLRLSGPGNLSTGSLAPGNQNIGPATATLAPPAGPLAPPAGPLAPAAGPLAPAADSSTKTSSSIDTDEEQARRSVQWLTELALRNAPRVYDGDKDWGDQKKLWAGVRMKLDGFKLKTHRRWREVNHGRWMRYEVRLPKAQASNAPKATIHQVRPIISETGQERWEIESSVATPMTFTARIQRWNLGVKLYSLTISGDLRVRLNATSTIGFSADYSEIPPALIIDPKVEKAILVVEHFEVDRISKIGGDVAEETGEWLEDVLRDKFLKKQNDRLVGKLNRSLDKQRDDLRLSLADWIENW